jgi:hypothetical protein
MGRQKQSFDELIIAINYNHKIQTKRRMSDAGNNLITRILAMNHLTFFSFNNIILLTR